MESAWIKVRDLPANTAIGSSECPDVMLHMHISPYDVPYELRGIRTKNNCFRIEFRYIDGEERGRDFRMHDHVLVTLGRHSERVLGIEIDVKTLGAKSVSLQLTQDQKSRLWAKIFGAIAELEAPNSGKPALHHDQVRRVLEASEDKLLQAAIA